MRVNKFYVGDTVKVYWVLRHQFVEMPKETCPYHHIGLTAKVDEIDAEGKLVWKHGKGKEGFMKLDPKQVELYKRPMRNWVQFIKDFIKQG
jgi:hypothetical protein